MGGSERFVSGAGSVNVDLIFSGLPRVPAEGQELYARGFSLQMGGGIPATLINLGRLGVPVRIQTGLGRDLFSAFAEDAFREAHVAPCNLCPDTDGIPLNITTAMLTPGDRTFVSYTDSIPVTDEVRQRVYEDSRGAAICAMDLRFPEVYAQLKKEGTLLTLDTGWDDELSIEKYRPFLELADFIDVPLKNYSSGMVARIGFAIATITDPDILIVDEVLAVGDFLFQEKCEKRIKYMMDKGTTILIVSHSIEQIERLCNRVLWLEKGKMRMLGEMQPVCDAYKAIG